MEKEEAIVTVIVPAAGQGLRMGGIRKQIRLLGGAPVLVHTLRLFEASTLIKHIVVSAPSDDVSEFAATLRRHDITKLRTVVGGGSTRQASVAAAMGAIPEETGIVMVHDGVRPFVPQACIEAVIETTRRKGAAALAVPANDTIRRGSEGSFGETVERDGLFRMQTPQAFWRTWFVDAHRAALTDAFQGTDDVALVQRIGQPVAIVLGSPLNIKITTPDDWALAEAIWTLRERTTADA